MTARCRKCKRPLRVPSPDDLGRVCRAKLRAAQAVMETALAGLSEAQKVKALALIGSGEVKPANRPGWYRVPSSDGVTTYLVSWSNCGCRAADFGNLCAHVGAVRCIEAVKANSMRRAA